jgi:PIN domain nuclease of toxin-antitoxin system
VRPLLVDTHVLLWWLSSPTQLADTARDAIADAESTVFVSAASAWEIAIKKARGKLRAPSDLEARLDEKGFARLAITVSHALKAGALPPHHADPFDRMLVAQAELEGLTLVTRDPRIAQYGVAVLPA